MKRALLSVWGKTNIVDLAKFLVSNQFEIISTGGTKKTLEDNGIKVISVSDVTEFDEVMAKSEIIRMALRMVKEGV